MMKKKKKKMIFKTCNKTTINSMVMVIFNYTN